MFLSPRPCLYDPLSSAGKHYQASLQYNMNIGILKNDKIKLRNSTQIPCENFTMSSSALLSLYYELRQIGNNWYDVAL